MGLITQLLLVEVLSQLLLSQLASFYRAFILATIMVCRTCPGSQNKTISDPETHFVSAKIICKNSMSDLIKAGGIGILILDDIAV
jgi:hypothetical protein